MFAYLPVLFLILLFNNVSVIFVGRRESVIHQLMVDQNLLRNIVVEITLSKLLIKRHKHTFLI